MHEKSYSLNYKLAKENNLAGISTGKPNSYGKLSTQILLKPSNMSLLDMT